jgi:hypothetical protein
MFTDTSPSVGKSFRVLVGVVPFLPLVRLYNEQTGNIASFVGIDPEDKYDRNAMDWYRTLPDNAVLYIEDKIESYPALVDYLSKFPYGPELIRSIRQVHYAYIPPVKPKPIPMPNQSINLLRV